MVADMNEEIGIKNFNAIHLPKLQHFQIFVKKVFRR